MSDTEAQSLICSCCGYRPARPGAKLCVGCRRDQHKFLAKPENRVKARARAKQWHSENRERSSKSGTARNRFLLTGWTQAMYDDALVRQQGRCAICGEEPGRKGLCADHDHSTKKPRELLCHRCNMRLMARHDEELWLEAALAYVRKHKGAPQ